MKLSVFVLYYSLPGIKLNLVGGATASARCCVQKYTVRFYQKEKQRVL